MVAVALVLGRPAAWRIAPETYAHSLFVLYCASFFSFPLCLV